MQSSFFFRCSPGRFAILHSILGEDTSDLLVAAVVPALPGLEQPVAAVVLLLPVQLVHQHIVVAAGQLDTLSLAHDSAAAVHTECAALEWKEGQERLRRELQASFVVAVLLEEQGPTELHAFEAVAGLAGFALLTFCCFLVFATSQFEPLNFLKMRSFFWSNEL